MRAEHFAEHRPDVPQCVGDVRYRGSKTSEEHYIVIYIVPRTSPLNCRSRIRYAVPSVCFGAMMRLACNAHATALCANKAMPVPCGRCSSNNAKITPRLRESKRIRGTAGIQLIEFGSADAALRCAVDTQRPMAVRNSTATPDERLEFRIGINLGDIIVDGDGISGTA